MKIWENFSFDSFKSYLRKRPLGVMFNRAGIAYDVYGNGISDNTGRFNNGLLIEEKTTNLLTANQSNGCEDGTTTGFYSLNTGTTIASSTEQTLQGTHSLKITCNGSISGQGVAHSLSANVSSNSTCTVGFWIKGEKGVTLRAYLAGRTSGDVWVGADYVYPVMTGNWQFVTITRAMGSTEVAARLYIDTGTTTQITTFYVDMLQIEQKYYPTSWVLGGTTRNNEMYTVPSSVLNIDTNGTVNLLTASQSTCENASDWGISGSGTITKAVDTATFYEGTGSIKITTDGNGTGQGIGSSPNVSVTAGVTYTASAMVKAPGGSTLAFQLCERDSSGTLLNTATYTFTGTSVWQSVSVSWTFNTGVNASIKLLTSGTAQAAMFYMDQCQLEPRSSASDWVLGGTQRNGGQGTIECECYIPDLPSDVFYTLFRHNGAAPDNRISISSNGGGSLVARITNNMQTTSDIVVSLSTISVGWHKLAIAWDSTEFKFYIDGIQVGSTVSNPKLPQQTGTFNIGSAGSTWWLNSYIKNIAISNIKRTDADILSRSQATTVLVDENVTAIFPLQQRTNGYRMGDG